MAKRTDTRDRKRSKGVQPESIYRTILERICLLQYPPGAMLKEGELAAEFGVSRTPIRHVLLRLEFEGLVTIEHGSGTYVTSVDLRFLKEIYAFRLKLSELIGELSATALAEEDFAELDRLLEQCDALYDQRDWVELGRIYMCFNEIVMRTISNRPLRQISEQLFHQTSRVWLQILPDLDWGEELAHVSNEIADVRSALQAEDMPRLSEVRRSHMSSLLRRMGLYLGGPAAP